MKRRIALLMVGVMFGLTACGTQQVAEAPAEQAQETEAATEVAEQAPEKEVVSDFEENITYVEDMVLSTDLYSITMPEEFKGKFLAYINGNEISFYDKASHEAGFGGYAFSVVADVDKNYIAGGMYTKVGEIMTSDGQFVDVLKGYPSDVQWDYVTYQDMESAEDYNKLYLATDSIIESIEAKEGNYFMYGAGIKGEDLYFVTLDSFVQACTEGWDAAKFEENGLSPEYGALIQNEGEKALDKIGYAYRDISSDGVDDLLIGVIGDSSEPTVVYDIYTMVNREPAHVISGTSRNRCYALEYSGFANVASGGANENEVALYEIEPGTTNLMQQFTLKYDGYEDEKNPWFVSYDDGATWESMTEEEYTDRLKMTEERYLNLDLKPISDLIPIDYSKVDLSKYGTFTKMIDDFKPGMGYANEPVGDTDVFFVSSACYNGENDTKNAIDSTLFVYDNDAIAMIGQVASIGTAYPVTINDGYIYVGGHHNVFKYTVKDGKLVVAEEASEVFDTNGNSTYYYAADGAEAQEVKDDSNLTRIFDEYFSGKPVEYSVVQ
ncbi:hypothetical protein [Butyrivibrio sp. XPD2006]|uniref:hypothetical protein n=1 Tax=Butyrivibrio sp. XPD2006 TaxID=1280668 RepID=UPI0003B74C45|nr:hypothetical protein [Butyrivibrio sp. XPD2006]